MAVYGGTRRKALLRTIPLLCLVSFLFLGTAFALDYGEVKELLRAKVPEQAIVNVVRQGISFLIDPQQEAELRSLGAGDPLIAALKEMGAPQVVDQRLGDGTGEVMTMNDLGTGATTVYVDPGVTTSMDSNVTYYTSPEVIVESPTVIYDSGYYDPNYYYYESYPSYGWGSNYYWGGSNYRPHRPGNGPPIFGRPPRPPSGRPPGRPPGGPPPQVRPPGRPPGGRPPGGRPGGDRPWPRR